MSKRTSRTDDQKILATPPASGDNVTAADLVAELCRAAYADALPLANADDREPGEFSRVEFQTANSVTKHTAERLLGKLVEAGVYASRLSRNKGRYRLYRKVDK